MKILKGPQIAFVRNGLIRIYNHIKIFSIDTRASSNTLKWGKGDEECISQAWLGASGSIDNETNSKREIHLSGVPLNYETCICALPLYGLKCRKDIIFLFYYLGIIASVVEIKPLKFPIVSFPNVTYSFFNMQFSDKLPYQLFFKDSKQKSYK